MTQRIALRPVEQPHEGGGRVVLNNLSEQIRECLEHAEDCGRKAAAQTDPKLKEDFLDMERRWLALMQSYDFTQRLGDFSDEAKRIRRFAASFQKRPPNTQSVCWGTNINQRQLELNQIL